MSHIRSELIWRIIEFVNQELTGLTYPYLQFGKLTAETYKFAESALTDRMQELYGVRRLPSV